MYTYVYNGSQLSRMTYRSNTMRFTYGADGTPLTINLNGTTYYYVTNLQGDVVAILNSSGTMVVSYTYDAWGQLLGTVDYTDDGLGTLNPLRYRGYVYDVETGLYYLQSRYYNPTWGRFINADSQLSTSILAGVNLFVYCYNNPVCFSDSTGKYPDDYFGYIGQEIGKWLYEIITTDENEVDCNGELTLNAKIKQTGLSILYNLEISAGIGMGLYGEWVALDAIGVSAGMYITNHSICYSDGQWKCGNEAYTGISGTFAWAELGAAESGFRPCDGQWQNETWTVFNNTKDSMTVSSFAFFAGAGITVQIGFDHITFLKDISAIWGI